jgi:hypothetical protein
VAVILSVYAKHGAARRGWGDQSPHYPGAGHCE